MDRSQLEIVESKVTISLPLWVCEDKFEQRTVRYNPSWHAYPGAFDSDSKDNVISEELFEYVDGYKQTMFHPMNCWIEVEVTENTDINTVIDQIVEVLDRFEDEDYVEEATKTKYINKPEG